MAAESAEARLKRMAMRSWRRGTKEMDLILGPYADARLAEMDTAELELFDRLLAENDQDLITWVMGTAEAPGWAAELIGRIGVFARGRLVRGN
jgi:antitoxin CptB